MEIGAIHQHTAHAWEGISPTVIFCGRLGMAHDFADRRCGEAASG